MLGLVLFGIALASAVGTFNAEACIACERDESLAAGSVIMFMKPGTVFFTLVLGFMARTAGASDIRFPYEGAALLSVVMMGVFWVNGLVRSSLKNRRPAETKIQPGVQPGIRPGFSPDFSPGFSPEFCHDIKSSLHERQRNVSFIRELVL